MGTVRKIASSYWTALVLGLVAIALHIRWYMADEKVAGGEVLSGFGATLVVLGVLVASRPYFRAGFSGLVQSALPQNHTGFLTGPDTARRHRENVEAALPEVKRDVWAERVVAVVVVIVGTLLNGYGPLVARLFGMRAG